MDDRHERQLLAMIDRLLSGDMAFQDFSRDYYSYYIDTLPQEALTERQREFFFAAQERLDWTGEELDDESRHYGWMYPVEYIAWLRGQRESYARARALLPKSDDYPPEGR